MKKFLSLLLLAALLAAVCLGASAADICVRDDASLLTAEEVSALDARLRALGETYNCDILILTVDSLGGKNPHAFSDEYFESAATRENGILLLLAMGSRDYDIASFGEFEKTFGATRREYIADAVVPLLRDGEYADAFEEYADRCEKILAGVASGKLTDNTELPKDAPSIAVYLVALGIGLLVALIATLSMRGKLRSVRSAPDARHYVRAGSFDVRVSRERFLYRNVTRTARVKDDSSHSGGGHSSSGSSSGHHTSGKF